MKILFLHGWHSVVGGVKPTHLRSNGHEIINPPLDDDNFEFALQTAQSAFDEHRPDVVVGSSRGGAIAMNIQSGQTPLVLLCPAWKNWGDVSILKPNSVVLHSRQDDVIPFHDSEALIAKSGLSPDALIEVGHDHRLADDESLSVMLWACNVLAAGKHIDTLDNSLGSLVDSTPNAIAPSSQLEGRYICDSCGEEIVIPLDATEGESQTYTEDCPVCCNPNLIHVEIDAQGDVQVWSEPEQDHD